MPDYKLRIVIEGEDRASGSIKNVGSALGSLGNIAGGVAIGNLLSDGVKGLAGMAKGALDSYASFERLGQSINALTAKQALLAGQAGTMEQALAQTSGQSKELLNWIQKLAIESPFRQDDVAQAFRMSMALGFNTSEAQRLTSAMLNFATATGQGGDTIERISRALGQMRTKGRVSMEEINQLTEAGVDVMRILQQATGKTGEALSKDIQKGAVDANTAIDAILTDTEKLYAGAGKASATSMAGLLSSLQEIQEITGRNLLSGMFEQLQGPLSSVVTILSAPEFQAGITALGDKLGKFSSDQIQGAAGAMERINSAIQPLLAAGAPGWLTALQTVMAAGDQTLGITISPTVTTIKTPDGGLNVEVKPWGTTVTNKDGGLLDVNLKGKVITIDPNTNDDVPPLKLVADWKEGTIGSAIAAFQAKTQEEQNRILLNADWKGDALGTLQTLIDATQFWVKTSPVLAMGNFAIDSGKVLWDAAQAAFTGKPVDVETKANDNSLWDMWNKVQSFFSSNPVVLSITQAFTGTPTTVPDALSQINKNMNALGIGTPGGPGWNSPKTSSTGGPTPTRKRATGDGFFYGGLALVGEEGPELVQLPRGAKIFSNSDTKRMIPGFAGGTTQLPPGAGPIVALLGSLGLWKPTGGAQMGPATRDQAFGWKDFTTQGTEALKTVANQTGQAFEDAAKKAGGAFESALQSVPGLFGTSQVTADDMRKSQLGLYQPKADEYLRQLSDEVLNGKEHGSKVDIKDAAARAGIDPNLPNDIILELVKEAWNNSSLFAEGKNLDLINTDAVKASIEQQQKQLSGQASLKMLFGINDENLQAQSEALGQGLASVFGGASETDAVKGAGTALFAQTLTGFTDPATAAAGVKGMADSIVSATGTPENQQALYDAGEAGYDAYYHGWTAKANAAPIVPPGGGAGTTLPGTTPPGNALGTPSWRGGWTVVGEYGPELLNLPGNTSIYDAPTTQRARRGGMRPMVVNQTFIVNDKLIAEQAAQRAVQLIRKGGR